MPNALSFLRKNLSPPDRAAALDAIALRKHSNADRDHRFHAGSDDCARLIEVAATLKNRESADICSRLSRTKRMTRLAAAQRALANLCDDENFWRGRSTVAVSERHRARRNAGANRQSTIRSVPFLWDKRHHAPAQNTAIPCRWPWWTRWGSSNVCGRKRTFDTDQTADRFRGRTAASVSLALVITADPCRTCYNAWKAAGAHHAGSPRGARSHKNFEGRKCCGIDPRLVIRPRCGSSPGRPSPPWTSSTPPIARRRREIIRWKRVGAEPTRHRES